MQGGSSTVLHVDMASEAEWIRHVCGGTPEPALRYVEAHGQSRQSSRERLGYSTVLMQFAPQLRAPLCNYRDQLVPLGCRAEPSAAEPHVKFRTEISSKHKLRDSSFSSCKPATSHTRHDRENVRLRLFACRVALCRFALRHHHHTGLNRGQGRPQEWFVHMRRPRLSTWGSGIDWNGGIGKQWKEVKKQFRPGMKSARKSYDERQAERVAVSAMKAREKEMKDEKAQKKKVIFATPTTPHPASYHQPDLPYRILTFLFSSQDLIQTLKERREKAEEKVRFEKLAARMHQKKIDRMKRREKRNKALKER